MRGLGNNIRRGGELVTLLSDESKRAIADVILHAQERLMNPRKIAQLIRPLIGLNTRQASANVKYREKIYQNYLERGVNEEISARHYIGVRRAISEGLMGRCQMIWTTAGKDRVCARCRALKNTVVGYMDESGVTLPPLHPRCRCTISYREVDAPKPPESNKPRGLAAGNEIYFNEGGKSPYKIGEIDFKNATQINQALTWFESLAVQAPVENALIITVTGEVYHCTGGLNTLTNIEDLGEKLRGAIVTHNHPIGSANEYSFSEADWNLFKKFNLYRLRGIDEFFIYELNRNATDLDEMDIIIDNYNYKHWDNVRKAKIYEYGYRRWRR